MGMFDGMNGEDIPTGGQRIYFAAGSYRVKIDVIKSLSPQEAQDGIGSYIGEFAILNSTNLTLKPGAIVGWVEKLKPQYLRKCFANIKGFLASAFGVEPGDFDAIAISLGYDRDTAGVQQFQNGNLVIHFDRMAADMASESNPLGGMALDLVCTEKPKQKTEGVFTVHHWHPIGYLNETFGPPAA